MNEKQLDQLRELVERGRRAQEAVRDVMREHPWVLDEYNCWNLYAGGAHVWITPRPSYCDRGHYQANVDGIASIDWQDSFPRYFMDLQRAKLEMEEWLAWRLTREADRP